MIVHVKVKTNQPSFAIKKGDIWTVSLTASPEKNKANEELVKELSRIYSGVRIISGLKSRRKVIEIGVPKR